MGYSTKSVLFNGSTQYGTAGDVLDFEYTSPFSISVWFKTATTDIILLSKEDTTNYRGYEVGLQNALSNSFYFVLRNDNSPSNQITVHGDTTGLNDGKWHHAAVTWKGDPTPDATTDVELYVDGVPQTLTIIDNSLTGTTLNAASFNVGARNDGTDGWWDGSVDEVAIYDRELDATEVQRIFNLGNPSDLKHANMPSNLVWWCRMGENGTPPTLDDEVGSNDLTLVNSPTISSDAPEDDSNQYASAYDDYDDPGHTMDPVYAPAFSAEYVKDAWGESTWQQSWDWASTVYFRMRATDITCPEVQQPAYVYWTVVGCPDWNADQLDPGDLPCGTDPHTDLDDIQIAAAWIED